MKNIPTKELDLKPVIKLSKSDREDFCNFGVSEFGEIYYHVKDDNGYTLKILQNGTLTQRNLGDADQIYHFAQPFGDSDVLTANARSWFDKKLKKGEENVKLLRANGEFASLCLGDGIEKIMVQNGKIYVSYFDEGIFGNYGWSEPMGACGFAIYGMDGERIYAYDDPNIADCYAMNLWGGDAYIHYYDEFKFVRIGADGGKCEYDAGGFAGCDFAINGSHALFREAYSKENELFLFEIARERLVMKAKILLRDGANFSAFTARTNGKFMAILNQNKFYLINLYCMDSVGLDV